MIFIVELVDLQKVGFHLLIKLIRNTGTVLITWAWLGPLPAHWARLDDVGYIVERDLRYANSIQKSLRRYLGSVPPSDVELPQDEPDCTFATCT